MGDADRKGYWETENSVRNKKCMSGKPSKPDPNFIKNLRKSNISLGKTKNIFQSTAQSSFTSITDNDLKNARPERGPDIRASVLTIGKGKHEVEPQSISASNFGTIDTAKYKPERVGRKTEKNSICMGLDARDWSTTAGNMPAPVKGVQYTPSTNIRVAMAATNWNAGTDSVNYVSETAGSNSKANLPIVRTQLAEPAKSNNVALGYHRRDYATEGTSSFQDTKIDAAELREHKAVIQSMKTKVRQSNISLGVGKTGYNTSSKDSLFNPNGDDTAYRIKEEFDKKKLYQTNFDLGFSAPQFDTTATATFFDKNNDKKVRDACSHVSKASGGRHLINNISLDEGDRSKWSSETNNRFPRHAASSYKVEREDKKSTQNGSHLVMGLDKRTMVPTSVAATTDEKALYDIMYKKHKGADLRRTNFSLGTDKPNYNSVAVNTFQRYGAKIYLAAQDKKTQDAQKTSFKMGSDKCEWKTTAELANDF